MIAYNICNETPKLPSQVSSLALPPVIDEVVAIALAKLPGERFQNAHAFNHALQLAAGGVQASSQAIEATVVNLAHVELGPTSVADWDETTLSTVERNLARFVGPMARLLVRKASTQAHDVTELYTLLATNINDQNERRRFVSSIPGGSTGSVVNTLHTGERSEEVEAHTGRGTVPQTERSGSVGTRSMAPIPLEPAFVQETTQRLLVYLGPIGRVVARRAAEQAKSQQEFVELVAGHIGTQNAVRFCARSASTPEKQKDLEKRSPRPRLRRGRTFNLRSTRGPSALRSARAAALRGTESPASDRRKARATA
jgi:serine/threonine-protein kinase